MCKSFEPPFFLDDDDDQCEPLVYARDALRYERQCCSDALYGILLSDYEHPNEPCDPDTTARYHALGERIKALDGMIETLGRWVGDQAPPRVAVEPTWALDI